MECNKRTWIFYVVEKRINMSKPLIELITNESGDWEILRMDLGEDFEHRGHSTPNHVWIKLLKRLGYEVDQIEISDEDMEEENF